MNNRHVNGEDNHLFYNMQILDPEITCLIVKTKSFHNAKKTLFVRGPIIPSVVLKQSRDLEIVDLDEYDSIRLVY